MTNIYDQKHLPTIPIIDGVVKSPLAADAQLIRINEGGMKQTGAYEAGAEIEVTHGTVIELLANGNIVIMTVECVDPALVPVVIPEPEPIQENPETDSADATVERRSLTERARIVANDVFGKKWDDLTDKEKCDVLAIAQPLVGDFMPPRGTLCMPSEFEAAKTPMLRDIETLLGFRDPKKEFGGVDIPEQEDFPKLTKPDIVIVNPPGAEIKEPEYDPVDSDNAVVPELKGEVSVKLEYDPESLLENATPCTSDDSCTSSDDACTSDEFCPVSDDAGTGGSLSDEA